MQLMFKKYALPRLKSLIEKYHKNDLTLSINIESEWVVPPKVFNVNILFLVYKTPKNKNLSNG